MLRTNLSIKRDIVVSSASRVMTGPEVVGTRYETLEYLFSNIFKNIF